MRQRVGFARALSLDPEIILMDEPFSSVDEQTRELLQEQLLELWRETRKTVLFVTHSIDEAVYVANRVVVMAARPGRIVEDITYRSTPPAHQQRPGTAALWRDQVPCLGNSQTVYRRGDGAGCTPMTSPDDAALLRCARPCPSIQDRSLRDRGHDTRRLPVALGNQPAI